MKLRRLRCHLLLLLLVCCCLLFGGNTNGTQTVVTAGTRVQLSTASTACVSLTVQVWSTNTGTIWIGGNNVSAAGKIGLALSNGQTPPTSAWYAPVGTSAMYVLSALWLDATASGDGVTWACYK